MASATGLLALLRAVAPQFRSAADSLAFAVHGAVLCNGYRLSGVGPDVKLEGVPDDAPEVPVTGWDAQPDQFNFLYQSESVPKDHLLLKCLVVGDTLVTALAASDPGKPPATLELYISKFTTGDTSSAAKAFSNLDQLCAQVNSAVAATGGRGAAAAVGGSNTATTTSSSSRPGAAQEQQQQQQQQPRRRQPSDTDPLRIGPPLRPPMRVGEEDIMPLQPPGFGPAHPFAPGLGPGGGMHVGPGHPFFGDRMRHPDLGPGGFGSGGPGGVRWDPIAPEGMQGWRPEDYQHGAATRPPGPPPDIDPDIGPPPPGRGADWDSMFG